MKLVKPNIWQHRRRQARRMKSGFSLIELILYMALVSLFVTAAILFAWDLIFGQVKSDVQQEVTYNLQHVSKRITNEVRDASGINSVSATSISLANTDFARNPTVIDLSGGRIRIGYGSGGSCPTTSPCFLTSNRVTVSSLSFTDLSSAPQSYNIGFSLTVTSNSDREEYDKTASFTSAVELRSN